MDFDLKKPFIILCLFAGLCAYIHAHYTVDDVLKFTRKNRDLSISPALDYYIGMGYYIRSDYDKAGRAFTQLLTDYTTTQYTPGALFRLGASYDEMLKRPEAREAYEQYLIRFPEGSETALVQRRYDQIKFK